MEKGFYADSLIRKLVEKGRILFLDEDYDFDERQIQPASFEPRIGNVVYVGEVIDRMGVKGWRREEFNDEYLLKRGFVYRFPLVESFDLPKDVGAFANPKSRIGRVGLVARLIADRFPEAYDVLPRGYRGEASLEMYSRAFDYLIKPGMSFNQLRFMNAELEEIVFGEDDLRRYLIDRWSDDSKILSLNGKEIPLKSIVYNFEGDPVKPYDVSFSNGAIVLHNTNVFSNPEGIVAYASKDSDAPLDLTGRLNKWEDFFRPIYARDIKDGALVAEPNMFFINSSQEVLYCPEDILMATVPYNPNYGNFRGDHAGFVDPGFFGTLTFEPIVYEGLGFALRDGTPMLGLKVSPLVGRVEKIYGEARNSHFLQRGVKLAPFFE